MEERLNNLSRWLEQEGHDLAFIHSTHNVFYLTGFWCEPHERLLGLMVSPANEPVLICPMMEKSRVLEGGWSHQVVGYSDTDNPWTLLGQTMDTIGAASLAVEKDALSLARSEQLRLLFPDASFADAGHKLDMMRAIKDQLEIEALRQASRLADEAVRAGVAALEEGISELEVAAILELNMKRKGVNRMSFPTVVLFGEKAANPHGETGDRKLQAGDLVLFDLGVVWKGYCSDITRTVAFRRVSHEQRSIYETVRQANQAALAATRPGVRMGDIDLAARRVIDQAGFGQYFTHRVGHGLGLGLHEYPSVHQNNDHLLKEGMVFTIEPGIYLAGHLGVRIEDDVVVTGAGVEVLTSYPKELQIV